MTEVATKKQGRDTRNNKSRSRRNAAGILRLSRPPRADRAGPSLPSNGAVDRKRFRTLAHACKGRPNYSVCSSAAGIFATDISERATWFSNWSAFSSSARDFDSRLTTALWRSC